MAFSCPLWPVVWCGSGFGSAWGTSPPPCGVVWFGFGFLSWVNCHRNRAVRNAILVTVAFKNPHLGVVVGKCPLSQDRVCSDEIPVTVDGFGAAMQEKCAPSQGFGCVWTRRLRGWGGGRRTESRDHEYIFSQFSSRPVQSARKSPSPAKPLDAILSLSQGEHRKVQPGAPSCGEGTRCICESPHARQGNKNMTPVYMYVVRYACTHIHDVSCGAVLMFLGQR